MYGPASLWLKQQYLGRACEVPLKAIRCSHGGGVGREGGGGVKVDTHYEDQV